MMAGAPAARMLSPPMLRAFLITWVATAVAFGIVSWLLDGVEVSGGAAAYLWVSLVFGLVNALLGTLLRLVTLPLALITLGLIGVVVNAVLIEVTDALTRHLTVDSFFWSAIWAAIVLAVTALVVARLLMAAFPR